MEINEPSDLIERALTEAITSFEDYEEGDFLVEWVVVAYVANPNVDTHSYPQMYSNGNIPRHRAIGLLNIALQGLQGLNKED